ncbi:MAG: DUF47 family protein [Labilithrix sp.]|nr:DUF47 family protein [Labilithrix sp.]MCW5810127.1 DUF47 family protein [Labilithrix sp.]
MFGSATKDAVYFDAFCELAQKSEEAAEILVKMFARMDPAHAPERSPYSQDERAKVDDETRALSKKVKELETQGDTIERATIRRLRENWITPLDRNDIHSLIVELDNVLDYIEAVADRIVLFDVRVAPREAKELADVLVQTCKKVSAALGFLKNPKKAQEMLSLCEDVFRLESEADKVYRRALATLFAEGSEPLMVMKWREIFDSLESAVDRCQDVATLIQGIALEYA